MIRCFSFVSIVLLLFFYGRVKAQNTPQNCSTIKLGNNWTIEGGSDFSCSGGYGIDSYNGNIKSYQSGLHLSFTISEMGPQSQSDCSLTAETKIFTSIQRIFEKLYDAPATNKIHFDTINNRIALLIEPQTIGKGRTAVYITDCASGSSLLITAENLSAAQHEMALKIFKTLLYKRMNYLQL